MSEKHQVAVSELEIREIGLWPLEYRIMVMIVVSGVAMFLSYWVILKDNFEQLYSFTSQQQKLIATFTENYQQSSNLDAYKKQMKDIQSTLQSLLQKLPSKGEIPILLEDISQQAVSSGLRFELIKPEDPVDKGFYVEQPIKMVLIGKYHGFGNFAEGISKLPRIVTLHDFSIIRRKENSPAKDAAGKDIPETSSTLSMEIYAKTYWYLAKEQL